MARKIPFNQAGRAKLDFNNGFSVNVIQNPDDKDRCTIILYQNGIIQNEHKELSIKDGFVAVNCGKIKRDALLKQISLF